MERDVEEIRDGARLAMVVGFFLLMVAPHTVFGRLGALALVLGVGSRILLEWSLARSAQNTTNV